MSAGRMRSRVLPAKNGAMWLRRSEATVSRCDLRRPFSSRRWQKSCPACCIVTRSASCSRWAVELPHAPQCARGLGLREPVGPALGADVADLAPDTSTTGPVPGPDPGPTDDLEGARAIGAASVCRRGGHGASQRPAWALLVAA